MDDGDLELFERTLRHATDRHTGGALDAALDESGWHEALATDPRAAISVLFELQGAGNSTSSALGHVVTHALGIPRSPGTGVVLPAVGRADPPGTVHDHGLRVHGLAPGILADLESALVVSTAGDDIVTFTVPTASLALRRRGGHRSESGPAGGDRRRHRHRGSSRGRAATGPGPWPSGAWPSPTS